ncbi:co-chaperone GrpE [Platysternon megacephalum]|uniref:Co-chaperone GrpE n=1 Tax=Platysternon megacephalum TaxID=55544 RepID=A0A4D9DD86_9SAUR|nr:co-chaperone GrpE [Platysternon megacephalum]
MSLVILSAQQIDGSVRDLYIDPTGRFADPAKAGDDVERFDGQGLIALPGLVDLHAHLREPGQEEAETIQTGTAAAAAGGFTSVSAMPNTNPITSTVADVEFMQGRALETASTHVEVIGSITTELTGGPLSDIGGMHDRCGVTMFSNDGFCVMNAQTMREALDIVARFDGVLAQHSQDHNLAPADACVHESDVSRALGVRGWPSQAESAIVARDCELAELTGARLHVCHISTAETVDVIRRAKQRGVHVTAEVTPHHLYLSTAEIACGCSTYKVNPPLRTERDIDALRDAFADGTIDSLGTDHAPHPAAKKDKPLAEAAFGMLAYEQALGVVIETMVLTGRMDWQTLAERTSFAPARIGRIKNQGRPIAVGEPANVVLIDPTSRAIVDREQSLSKSRNNPYHGRELPDPVRLTLWGGRETYRRR